MKKLIMLASAALLVCTGAFAAKPAKAPKHNKMYMHEQVSLIPLHQEPGFAVMVDKELAGKTTVIIDDNDGNTVFKDMLTKGTRAEKKYNLSKLAAGNYTVEVFSKGHDVKTRFYVYNKSRGKVIFLV
ncbi:MAG TPA: hypothetical protein VHC47_13385 [Mucilaginibacter sp.]|nr:hypothetical protein [Mucilaginibacter sp.]